MKKFIKSISVYLTVAMILCCSVFAPAFAAGSDVVVPFNFTPDVIMAGTNSYGAEGWVSAEFVLPAGSYVVDYNYDLSAVPESVIADMEELGDFHTPVVVSDESFSLTTVSVLPGSVFKITEDMVLPEMEGELSFLSNFCMVRIVSYGMPTVTIYEPPKQTGMYYQAFDMFAGFIYGEGVVLTAEQNMVLTILATTAVLFVVVVPFLLVFWFIRMFR